MVLLKDVLICAWPTAMCFLTFRRPRAGRFGAGIYFFVAFFLPATCMRRGPLRAAASAVTWAAKGVDLREPLKPAPPADSHAMTLPSRSVRETIVLLNDVLMCAWPIGMFFFGRRRPRSPARRTASTSGSP